MSLIKRIRHFKYTETLPEGFEEAFPGQYVDVYRLEFEPHPRFTKLNQGIQIRTYISAINTNSCYLQDSYYHRYEHVSPKTLNPADAATAYFYYRTILPNTIYAPSFNLSMPSHLSIFFMEITEDEYYNLIEIPLSLFKIKEKTNE